MTRIDSFRKKTYNDTWYGECKSKPQYAWFLLGWLLSKRQQIKKFGKDMEKSIIHCWWKCQLLFPLWKIALRFLKKLKLELSYDTVIPLPTLFFHFHCPTVVSCSRKNVVRLSFRCLCSSHLALGPPQSCEIMHMCVLKVHCYCPLQRDTVNCHWCEISISCIQTDSMTLIQQWMDWGC